ncbi:MAG: hypothetical protein AAFQ71_15070 [Planctomycetota bacterium]
MVEQLGRFGAEGRERLGRSGGPIHRGFERIDRVDKIDRGEIHRGAAQRVRLARDLARVECEGGRGETFDALGQFLEEAVEQVRGEAAIAEAAIEERVEIDREVFAVVHCEGPAGGEMKGRGGIRTHE